MVKTEGSQEIAAAKSGMDAKTARKIGGWAGCRASCHRERVGGTRPDRFAKVGEIRELLEVNAGLEAKTVFEYLQRRDPGQFADGQLRTLQRRVKGWRATEGPAREVFFAQHLPGRLGASDFTHMEELGVTRKDNFARDLSLRADVLELGSGDGMLFRKLRKPVRRTAERDLGAGQGAAAASHRSAVNGGQQRERSGRVHGALPRLAALLRVAGRKTQAGHGNENGDVEQRHHRFKRAVGQELLLRGSRDFASVAEYQQFLQGLFERLNAGRKPRLVEEMKAMQELPERRMESCKRERVRVDSGSLIYVDRNVYSVPSRLIGEQVEARLYLDQIEVWYGQKKVEQLSRLRGRQKHRVDYRHIIDWLVRKPGAFEHYRYRDELFPTSRFRMAFDLLQERRGRAQGSKEYLRILELAAKDSEVKVDEVLRVLLAGGEEEISTQGIAAMLGVDRSAAVRDVQVAAV